MNLEKRTCTKLKHCQCRDFLTQNGQFQFNKACIFTPVHLSMVVVHLQEQKVPNHKWRNCIAHSCIQLKLNAKWFQPKVLYHWKVLHPGQDFSRRGETSHSAAKLREHFLQLKKHRILQTSLVTVIAMESWKMKIHMSFDWFIKAWWESSQK